MKLRSTFLRALILMSLAVLIQPRTAWSAGFGKQKDDREGASLNEDLATLREKVAQLEAALAENHQGVATQPVRTASISGRSQDGMAGQSAAVTVPPKSKSMNAMGGMGGMKSGKKMGMGGMAAKGKKMGMGMMGGKGMGLMGRMSKMAGMAMPSALPGFPGASHIYHIGSTGFFLDHGEHITLSPEQETKLNQYKEKALLKQATFSRKIEEAEQELWVLTGSDKPDAMKISAQVRKIAKLQGDQRIAFIRAVGETAEVLTSGQRKQLVGLHGRDLKAGGNGTSESPATNPNE